MKNVLVGQSGGPTAVINSSLAGVYETAKACGAAHVYGMQYGIAGVLEGKLVDLDAVLSDKMDIELLKRTPSSFLGSCRYKLPQPDVDEAPFVQLFDLFKQYDIGAVFYIGGNDSRMPSWPASPSWKKSATMSSLPPARALKIRTVSSCATWSPPPVSWTPSATRPS